MGRYSKKRRGSTKPKAARKLKFPPQDPRIRQKAWDVFRAWRQDNPIYGPITHREHLRRKGWKWSAKHKKMLPPAINLKEFYGR